MLRPLFLAAAILIPIPASAQTLAVQDVAPGIWAIEGPAEQRNAENLGNNATFGLIETTDGAVLIDPGGSWQGAEALHAVVQDLTDQPVVFVINTGGQDHRWLGNGYWIAQGATVIASADAVADQSDRASMQMSMLAQLIGDGLDGTDPAQAGVVFAQAHVLELGGRRIELHHPAPAHTPGDSFVWVPAERVVFTGDIVYIGRILGIMEFSDTVGWTRAFAAIEALDPAVLVPGHGPATDLAQAQADTGAYLAQMRARMAEHIDAGGDIMGIAAIDQSDFAHLDQFDALAGRNAQMLFQQMEWE